MNQGEITYHIMCYLSGATRPKRCTRARVVQLTQSKYGKFDGLNQALVVANTHRRRGVGGGTQNSLSDLASGFKQIQAQMVIPGQPRQRTCLA